MYSTVETSQLEKSLVYVREYSDLIINLTELVKSSAEHGFLTVDSKILLEMISNSTNRVRNA